MIQKDDAGDSISACDDDDDSLFLIYVCSHQTGECTSSAQTNGLNSSHQLHRNKSSSSYMMKIRMTRLLLNHMANVRWRAFKGWQSLLYVPRKIKHAKKNSAKYLYDDYEDLSTRTVTYLFTLQQHRHNKGASESLFNIITHIHAIIMCLVRVIIISDNKTIKNSFRA